MTVRAGREFLAVPGPTNIPDEVLAGDASPGGRDLFRAADRADRRPACAISAKCFATATRPYIYIANGHGAWEAALTNVLSRGDKILVLESGQFAIAWGDAAARLGVEIEVLKGDWRRAVRPADVEAAPARRQGRSRRSSPCRSRPLPASPTISRRSATPSKPRGTTRSIWSTSSPRSAACRSRWTPGASTLRCRDRRKA